MPPPTLQDLRRFAVSRSLFAPTGLKQAIERLGFVQADPIRAPARAQDLTLRHRVRGYRAGDLERRYARLAVEEDVFINYGFVSTRVHALMHPRQRLARSSHPPRTRAAQVLEFVRERGQVHPREVDAFFAHGTVTNYWGGSSSATTRLLEDLHYRGLLRVARRDRGIRVYELSGGASSRSAPVSPADRLDALVDVLVNKYGPLPAQSLSGLVRRLRYGVPQWRGKLRAALSRARLRLRHARVESVDWYWLPRESVSRHAEVDVVRFLAPFDPIVWDRRRFEMFWGWPYRFEAYTPIARRTLGYYALPLLWRDRVIGWANLSAANGTLVPVFGYVDAHPPRERAFHDALDAEVERMQQFLGLSHNSAEQA